MCDRCGPYYDPTHDMTESEAEEYADYLIDKYSTDPSQPDGRISVEPEIPTETIF